MISGRYLTLTKFHLLKNNYMVSEQKEKNKKNREFMSVKKLDL